MIRTFEIGGSLVIIGEYEEMKGVFPTLKRLGFKYRSTDHSWSIPLKQLGEDTKQQVDAILETAMEDQRRSAEAEGATYPIIFETGSGYSGSTHSVGDVIDRPTSANSEPDATYITVLKVKSRYIPEDGLCFGVGDDSGYLYTYYCRPANEEEVAHIMAKREKRRKEKEAVKRLQAIASRIREQGVWPPPWQRLNGKQLYLNKAFEIYGGGEWFVIEADRIWHVTNNGHDGDDWSHNNVDTCGAGAIGWAIPYEADLAAEILRLTELVAETLEQEDMQLTCAYMAEMDRNLPLA